MCFMDGFGYEIVRFIVPILAMEPIGFHSQQTANQYTIDTFLASGAFAQGVI